MPMQCQKGTSCGQVGRLCSPDCAEDCDRVFEGDECAFAYFRECGYRSRTLRLFCDQIDQANRNFSGSWSASADP